MKACLLVLLLLFPGFASPAAEPAAAKLKVLVITGGHGFEAEAFFKVFEADPTLAVTAAKQDKSAEAYERPDLLNFDVVVLYDLIQNITEEQKARFLSLFDKGIGLVVLHHALCSFSSWPEYEKIIGGHYPQEDPKAGYQHDVEVPIRVLEKEHPITAGLEDFTIRDEIYWGFRVQPDAMPLLTTTHPQSGKPIAWWRLQGQSRVFYLQLGHGPAAYANANYLKLVSRGIHWAAKR